jgi:hypothetical protein
MIRRDPNRDGPATECPGCREKQEQIQKLAKSLHWAMNRYIGIKPTQSDDEGALFKAALKRLGEVCGANEFRMAENIPPDVVKLLEGAERTMIFQDAAKSDDNPAEYVMRRAAEAKKADEVKS